MSSAGVVRTVESAGRALVDAAKSPAKVFLLPPRAPDARAANTGLDFLVVEEVVEARFAEAVRLSKVLGHLRIPGDVMVVDRAHFNAWALLAVPRYSKLQTKAGSLPSPEQHDDAAVE